MKRFSKPLSTLLLCLAALACHAGHAQTAGPAPLKKVAILLFDGVDVIDYAGPFEVFMNAPMEVFTVSPNGATVTTAGGMKVIPTYSFDNAPAADALLVPGGNVRTIKSDPATLAWIKQREAQGNYIMSVCNGAFTLANTGLLKGLKATTTSGNINALRREHADIEVVRDARVVDNGRILTTGGLSAGIDGALHLVERMDGMGAAQLVAERIEYNWQPEGSFLPATKAFHAVHQTLGDENLVGAGRIEQLVSSTGDKNHWSYLWRVDSAMGNADLAQSIDTALAQERKQMGMQPPYAASPAHRWTYQDSDKQVWHMQRSVTDAQGAHDKHLVELTATRMPM